VGRIQERRPDAVLLDVIFPENETAGFEVARSIRRNFGKLPVLLLTAVNQSFPLGFSTRDLDPTWLPAVEFIEKPVDFSLLCEKVAGILASAAK
ncbi:MAG: response regulator, partial [Thermoguttaceae bacterium]